MHGEAEVYLEARHQLQTRLRDLDRIFKIERAGVEI